MFSDAMTGEKPVYLVGVVGMALNSRGKCFKTRVSAALRLC